MTMRGWERKYSEILRQFKFSRKADRDAAKILNSILKTKEPLTKMESKIKDRIVFVIGAGPSLSSCIPTLKKFNTITRIVADGATRALIENGIKPDIVVTDLDGDLGYLHRSSKLGAVMVVHSHGDNTGMLPVASLFKNCIGTTECKPFDKIRNFGGFTDGDRCVFLAKHLGAKKIILFGMDFGSKVGFYSKSGRYNKKVKIKKLKKARSLLEWLSSKGGCEFYTTSQPIKGFTTMRFSALQELVRQ